MNLANLYNYFLACNGVSTDTRQILPGDLFFALKGPNFNGNAFAEGALSNGARYVVIDDPAYQKNNTQFLLVDDVLKALQQIANFHRSQFNIPVIALTGSNGKTTTKELINAVLATTYQTLATTGNLNNHIGVPLTLLRISAEIDMAVIEMGANKPGDIGELCSIADPTHGLITNIGKAHLEGLGGYDGVLKTKSQLYHYLIHKNGTIFINSGDPVLMNMSKRINNPVFYPGANDFYHCEVINANPFITYKSEGGMEITTHLIGQYNFDNIATALCIGKYFNVPEEEANEAVKNYNPSNNRSQLLQKDGNTIILDAYNANPDSMKQAIQNFESMKARQKVLILGDMLELGNDTTKEHLALGELLKNSTADMIFLCGKAIQSAREICEKATFFDNKDDLIEKIKNTSFNNALILIKGSRNLELESVTEYIGTH